MVRSKLWRYVVIPIVVVSFSATAACTSRSRSTQRGPIDKCTRVAESISFESLYVELIRGADKNNLGLDDETLKQLAQDMANDPSTKSMEFQSCLMADGFKCLPIEGIDSALAELLLDAARDSGWSNPTPNDCLSPDGEVIENRFASE